MKNLSRPARRSLALAAILSGLFAIYIALILLNDEFSSNIAYAKTMLSELSEWAYLGVELLAMMTAYAFLLLALFSDGAHGGVGVLVAYTATTVLRHAVLLWLGLGELWAESVNLLPELFQLGAVYVACAWSVHAFDRKYAVMKQGSISLGRSCPERTELVYPNVKQPLKVDPIKRGAAASALILVALRVFGRLIYDFHYGLPTDLVDALWMVLYYGLDVLIGVGGYCLMLYIIRRMSH